METVRGYHRDSRIKQMTLLNLAHSVYSLLRFHSFRDTSSQRQVIYSFSFILYPYSLRRFSYFYWDCFFSLALFV